MGTKEKLIERFKSQPKDFNWDDYVVLLNSPNYDYNKRYHQGLYDNVAGGQPITGLNVPIEVLARAAAAQLKDGRAVIFGNDVLKQMERKTGFLDTDLYKTDDLFSVDTQMSKADRLATGEGSATHDMTLVGVDEDNGEIRKWKVENSWGTKVGEKGYFVMDDKWFDEYLFKVVVKKQYLPEKLVKIAEGEATPVPCWDSMA